MYKRQDHLACDPGASLGPPALIAERFAVELRLPETRRATFGGFAALAVSGVLIIVTSLAISAAGGWPELGGARSDLVSLGGLALILGGQVSFVAGVLALWPFRNGDVQVSLVQRRMRVALVAAAFAATGEGTHALALRSAFPGWWFALAATTTVVSAIGLAAAGVALRRASALTPERGIVSQGVPRWFVAGTGVAVILAMTVGTAHAERSWIEGVIRGVLEGAAFAAGFLALGRFLGLRASVRHETVPTLHQ